MLTLTDVTTAMNGHEYQAVFTNSAGNATTNPATLTVNSAGEIITLSPSTVPSGNVGHGLQPSHHRQRRQRHAERDLHRHVWRYPARLELRS